MDLTYLRVNYAELGRIDTEMWQTLQDAYNKIEQLKEVMDSLNSMWEGPAHDAEMARFQTDYDNMKELCRVYLDLINRLEIIYTDYFACHDELAELVIPLS